MPDQTRPGHILAPTSDERIAELETLAERRLIRMQAAELDLIEARERIAELEAAQAEPDGFAVTVAFDDGRWMQTGPVLTRGEAEIQARFYAPQDARVVALREVRDA